MKVQNLWVLGSEECAHTLWGNHEDTAGAVPRPRHSEKTHSSSVLPTPRCTYLTWGHPSTHHWPHHPPTQKPKVNNWKAGGWEVHGAGLSGRAGFSICLFEISRSSCPSGCLTYSRHSVHRDRLGCGHAEAPADQT